MHFLLLSTQCHTIPGTLSQLYDAVLQAVHSDTVQTNAHKHTSPLQKRAFVDLWDKCQMRGISNPFWFTILLQIGHSLIKRWKKTSNTRSWVRLAHQTGEKQWLALVGTVSFVPTGPLPCTYISYVFPGEDKRSVCGETSANLKRFQGRIPALSASAYLLWWEVLIKKNLDVSVRVIYGDSWQIKPVLIQVCLETGEDDDEF